MTPSPKPPTTKSSVISKMEIPTTNIKSLKVPRWINKDHWICDCGDIYDKSVSYCLGDMTKRPKLSTRVHRKQNSGMFKKGQKGRRGIENPLWKGKAVGYGALHDWVKRYLGEPRYCVICHSYKKKKYEWASISKLYKRDLSDWKRLCTSCHRNFDGHGYKVWERIRAKGILILAILFTHS